MFLVKGEILVCVCVCVWGAGGGGGGGGGGGVIMDYMAQRRLHHAH